MIKMMVMMMMNANNEYDGAAYVDDMIDDDEWLCREPCR